VCAKGGIPVDKDLTAMEGRGGGNSGETVCVKIACSVYVLLTHLGDNQFKAEFRSDPPVLSVGTKDESKR